MTRAILWFCGKDLRVRDHGPLVSALAFDEVLPLFIMEPRYFDHAKRQPHRMQFLLSSLEDLDASLRKRGSRLILHRGKPEEILPRLTEEIQADRVLAHRRSTPRARRSQEELSARLPLELHDGETLAACGRLRTQSGSPFAVFTPFARAFREQISVSSVLDAPDKLPPLPLTLSSQALPSLRELGLVANPKILPGGEAAAHERLRRFLAQSGSRYASDRDRMDKNGTSRISQDLKFGTLSIRTSWNLTGSMPKASESRQLFENELLWREFAYHSLWDRPTLLNKPFRTAFEAFPWRDCPSDWEAWKAGKTGYPIVDAAQRQLLEEGFVHNRARMVSASFLTKHLMIDYREGESHFLRYLTDGDEAPNNMGWQWSAGCGCDAQPYFRVFNPMTQGKKFDPDGRYVRRLIPELHKLPTKYIHAPWEAPEKALREADLRLGENYPFPVVDHREARKRFLFHAERTLSKKTGQGQELH